MSLCSYWGKQLENLSSARTNIPSSNMRFAKDTGPRGKGSQRRCVYRCGVLSLFTQQPKRSQPVEKHPNDTTQLSLGLLTGLPLRCLLFAVLPHTRNSSGRQTVTSAATAATVSVRMSLVNVLIAGIQRLPMVLQSREASHEEEHSEHEAQERTSSTYPPHFSKQLL